MVTRGLQVRRARGKEAGRDGEGGARDLGGSMETTAVFPNADARRFFRLGSLVDVESILDSVSSVLALFLS